MTESYLMGIKDGRSDFKKYGMEFAKAEYDNCKETAKMFSSDSEVGQYIRGMRDFWKNQLKIHKL